MRKIPLDQVAIYLDMDGVLADFDTHARELDLLPPGLDLNRSRSEMTPAERAIKNEMYRRLRDENRDFFGRLPLMPDALLLWNTLAPAKPIILTAAPDFDLPEGNPHFLNAAVHKRDWVDRHLEPVSEQRFICTVSRRKPEFMGRKEAFLQVLIDDRLENCEAWEAKGGLAIHHKNAAGSLAALSFFVEGLEAFSVQADMKMLSSEPAEDGFEP